ncbi:hypothetical protein [Aminirod propionatiphilus]|uniref:Uncharacterized protein n=1 Tax=Aminirod propionatiphilus TaxID=3415223 RepID=A0ACD1DUS0_9BACT|nr:hypothetical protein KIH16_12290 [Synergistota bacterium]
MFQVFADEEHEQEDVTEFDRGSPSYRDFVLGDEDGFCFSSEDLAGTTTRLKEPNLVGECPGAPFPAGYSCLAAWPGLS